MTDPTDFADLKVMLARIEERQIASKEDVAALKSDFQAFRDASSESRSKIYSSSESTNSELKGTTAKVEALQKDVAVMKGQLSDVDSRVGFYDRMVERGKGARWALNTIWVAIGGLAITVLTAVGHWAARKLGFA